MLKTPSIDGYPEFSEELTDHHSEGFVLKIYRLGVFAWDKNLGSYRFGATFDLRSLVDLDASASTTSLLECDRRRCENIGVLKNKCSKDKV